MNVLHQYHKMPGILSQSRSRDSKHLDKFIKHIPPELSKRRKSPPEDFRRTQRIHIKLSISMTFTCSPAFKPLLPLPGYLPGSYNRPYWTACLKNGAPQAAIPSVPSIFPPYQAPTGEMPLGNGLLGIPSRISGFHCAFPRIRSSTGLTRTSNVAAAAKGIPDRQNTGLPSTIIASMGEPG